MTQQRDDVVGLEATIIMHPKIWEASGHTENLPVIRWSIAC